VDDFLVKYASYLTVIAFGAAMYGLVELGKKIKSLLYYFSFPFVITLVYCFLSKSVVQAAIVFVLTSLISSMIFFSSRYSRDYKAWSVASQLANYAAYSNFFQSEKRTFFVHKARIEMKAHLDAEIGLMLAVIERYSKNNNSQLLLPILDKIRNPSKHGAHQGSIYISSSYFAFQEARKEMQMDLEKLINDTTQKETDFEARITAGASEYDTDLMRGYIIGGKRRIAEMQGYIDISKEWTPARVSFLNDKIFQLVRATLRELFPRELIDWRIFPSGATVLRSDCVISLRYTVSPRGLLYSTSALGEKHHSFWAMQTQFKFESHFDGQVRSHFNTQDAFQLSTPTFQLHSAYTQYLMDHIKKQMFAFVEALGLPILLDVEKEKNSAIEKNITLTEATKTEKESSKRLQELKEEFLEDFRDAAVEDTLDAAAKRATEYLAEVKREQLERLAIAMSQVIHESIESTTRQVLAEVLAIPVPVDFQLGFDLN
jgi:hypothetical protein